MEDLLKTGQARVGFTHEGFRTIEPGDRWTDRQSDSEVLVIRSRNRVQLNSNNVVEISQCIEM